MCSKLGSGVITQTQHRSVLLSRREDGEGFCPPRLFCASCPRVCWSSVTAAFKDEQAVGLRSLLAWVVLTQPGGELRPNQGRACTPLVAVSEGRLPVTSRGRKKWAGQPTGTPKPSSLPPVSSHCSGLHTLHSACLRPSTLSSQGQQTGDPPWRPLEHLNKGAKSAQQATLLSLRPPGGSADRTQGSPLVPSGPVSIRAHLDLLAHVGPNSSSSLR